MIYKNIKFSEYSAELLDQIKKGAFMTTKVKDKVNTMTIGWGGINIIWNKSVFVAYVRYSRDTYAMLKDTEEFTINVPLNNDLKKELLYCGRQSGRDTNKIEDCKLTLQKGRSIETPVISNCELQYECKVIYKQAMEPNSIPKEVLKKYYDNSDFHVIFYGEIVDSYIIEGA